MSLIALNLASKVIFVFSLGKSWKKWLQSEIISDLFERESSKLTRKTREIAKNTKIPPKFVPKTLEEARRMRTFQLVAPASLKSVNEEEKTSTISFQHKR